MGEPNGDYWEWHGRFVGHVAQLELMARHVVTGYFAGFQQEPQYTLLYDKVIRYMNLGRLVGVLRAIGDQMGEPLASEYDWVLRDTKVLVDARNDLAHLPKTGFDRTPAKRAELTLLLYKVDSGLATFGTLIQAMPLNDHLPSPGEDPMLPDEAGCIEHARRCVDSEHAE